MIEESSELPGAGTSLAAIRVARELHGSRRGIGCHAVPVPDRDWLERAVHPRRRRGRAAGFGALVFITYPATGSRRTHFELSPDGLIIRGDLFGRRIPAGVIDAGGVRPLDLGQDDPLAPRRRTWGSGFPGYLAAWFRLRNGRKALLFVTDRSRLVYVPTIGKFDVMLSVDDPGAFVRRAKKVWGAGNGR